MAKLAVNEQTGEALYQTDSGEWKPAKMAKNDSGQTAFFNGNDWEVIDRRSAPKPAPEPADDRSMLKQASDYMSGLTDEALNTATFGMADKVKDFAGDMGTNAGNYIGGLINPDSRKAYSPQRSNEQRAEFREENPVSSFVASMAGGGANPIAGKVGQYMGAGKSLPSQMARGMAGGAGLSAAQAIGESDGPITERLKAGIEPAIVGGVVGPLVPAAVKLGSGGVTGIQNILASFGSTSMGLSKAAKVMAQALKDDGYTTKTALLKLKELGPESTLADLGDNTRSLVHSVYARGGPGSQQVAKFYSKRQGGTMIPEGQEGAGLQSGHAAGRVEGMIDDLGFGKYHDKQTLDKLQQEASDLYGKAYSANEVIDDPIINSLLNREGMGEVMNKAREGMRLRGENVSKYSKEATDQFIEGGGVGKVGEGLKLKFLDKVKRVLYDMEEGERDSITGRLTDKGGAWSEVRRDLTKALDEADSTGFYAQARGKAGDKLSSEQARRSGNNFISKSEFADEQTMADELAEMSEHELQNFRIGVANALKNKVGARKYKAGNAPDSIKGNDVLERKIKVAFGDDSTFVKFKNQLLAEDELHKTYSKFTGSPTNKNRGSSEYGDMSPDDILQGLKTATHSPVRGTIQTAMGIKDKLLMPENISSELARLLTGQNTKELTKKFVAQRIGREAQRKLAQKLLQGSSGAIGASAEPVNIRVDSNTRRSLANQLMQGR
jgi:hypothetical protein